MGDGRWEMEDIEDEDLGEGRGISKLDSTKFRYLRRMTSIRSQESSNIDIVITESRQRQE